MADRTMGADDDGVQRVYAAGDRKEAAAEETTAKKLDKLIERGKKRRNSWETHWQEVYEYVFPYREGFSRAATIEGQQRTDFIFDQTAVVGVPRFASKIQHGLFPPQGNAFAMAPGVDYPEMKRDQDLQGELDQITDSFHEGLRNSNFESELHEGCQDLGIGTMTLRCDPGVFPGDLRFTAVPPNHLYILPGPNDTVGTWIYERKISLEDVKATWPRARPNEKMKQACRSKPETMVTIFQITVADPKSIFEPSYQDYVYCPDHKCVLVERTLTGTGSCPWITARWSKTALEVWGRGPILQVMPSIKTVNLTVELVLENAEMAIAGINVYDDDGVFNPDNIRVEPGMFVPRAPGSKVESLQNGSRFDVSQLILADERENIRKGLFIDELDKEGKTPYSAEEVAQRMADTARNMGSVSGRLMYEFIQPLSQRIAYIYRKQGIVQLPRIDGKVLRLVPLSPLLRIQDQADVSNFIQYVQVMNGTMGPGTSGLALNRDRTVSWLNKKFAIPTSILNSPAEVKRVLGNAGQAMGELGAQNPELMKTAVTSGLKLLG